jgi:hypothetical protein
MDNKKAQGYPDFSTKITGEPFSTQENCSPVLAYLYYEFSGGL